MRLLEVPSRGALNPLLIPLPKMRGLQTTRGHIVQEHKAVAVLSERCEETSHAAGPFQQLGGTHGGTCQE